MTLNDWNKRQDFKFKTGKGYMIGSPIQQNIGESIGKHGYGIYDVVTKEYSYVDLPNPKPFLKFIINSFDDIENGYLIDQSELNDGFISNVEFEDREIVIPDVILPHRRDGKFLCLPHQTEGLINVNGVEKWAKGETTAKNERRYVLQMQQGLIDYKNDGINNMKYTYISTTPIFEKHKMINVHC